MKKIFNRLLAFLILSFFVQISDAQQIFFSEVAESSFKTVPQKRVIIPSKYRTLKLDTIALLAFLNNLPKEQAIMLNRNMAPVIEIPMPSGVPAKFRVWQSEDIAPELAAAYPNLKTFTGQGIDDPTATIKMDWTDFGFHAMVLSPISGSSFIDPFDQQTKTHYISYNKDDFKKKGNYRELPVIKLHQKVISNLPPYPDNVQAGVCVGTQLRRYRLAVACTHEYAEAATGLSPPTPPTVAQTLSAIVTTITRVNSVYERELSIRLVLIANNNLVVFPLSATDPFTGNNSPQTLINESQTVIDSRIGNANYDIGHTFSTGGGGLAGQGVVCITGEKSNGITGTDVPVGDPYDIDYVSHEMGHQFGAGHTFNTSTGFCGGNETSASNAEPGSGSTIMGYAGLCSPNNLQNFSNPQFHAVSFDEITTYSINSTGNSCASLLATGNNAPVVNAGSSYFIPISTPFVLTGSATDANAGDVLTYSWEQVDVGGPYGSPSNPSGAAPLFRSFPPVSTPVRNFPKLSDVINNTSTIGELLPTYSRVMNFRLTARDNKAGGGGVCYAQNQVTVVEAAGPFVVTTPTTTGISWTVGDFRTINWNTAGTDFSPISCANVSIQLSTNGGNTFPVTLIGSTPNDGNEEITVPNNVTNQARIRVIAVGNVFYDMSNNNFSIVPSPSATFTFNNPPTVNVCAANSGATTIKTASLSSFSTTINLTASLNPPGTTVVFGANSVAPGASTTVTLNNTGSLAPGTYTVRVTGTAGVVIKTRDISFIVGGGGTPTSSLSLPANDAIGVDVKPSFNWTAVSGALSYTLEISGNSNFSSIRLSVPNIISLPYSLTDILGEDSVYYWRVKTTNNCGVGAASIVNRFKTRLSSCRISYDVPKLISGAGATTVTSTLFVPASLGAVITDVNVVGLNGTHTYVQDLKFTLRSPAGTNVILFNQICGQDADFNLNLDNQSANTTFPCPPVGGVTVRPQNPLTAFNGQSSAGTWTLTVNDGFDGDGGSLNGWGLGINTNSNSCSFVSNPFPGAYTFIGNGNWSIPSNWSNNTIPPNPLPSGASITINHVNGGSCILNVTQNISPGATISVLTGKNIIIPGALNIQ